MMKYPYELSELRLSLLPLREQNRYKYEHSDYFDYTEKQEAINEYKKAYNQSVNRYYNALLEDNQEELSEELDEEYQAIAKAEADEQAEYLFAILENILHPVVEEGGMTEEEYKQLCEQVENELRFATSSLNEDTPGPDMTFWAKGIGAWISAGFGAVFGVMAGLIMAGKTKAAIHRLEEYMNELVELCDDGINKQRSIFKKIGDKIGGAFKKLKGWFKKKDKNKGDQSFASFREIQENFLSTYATKAMVLTKNMGFTRGDLESAIKDVEDNSLSMEGSGLNYFSENIGDKLNKLVNKN